MTILNTPTELPRIELDGLEGFQVLPVYDGMKHLYSFSNGYQASVISHSFSYGIEMAILQDGQIDYTTPLTDDVVPYIAGREELTALLAQIRDLKKGA